MTSVPLRRYTYRRPTISHTGVDASTYTIARFWLFARAGKKFRISWIMCWLNVGRSCHPVPTLYTAPSSSCLSISIPQPSSTWNHNRKGTKRYAKLKEWWIKEEYYRKDFCAASAFLAPNNIQWRKGIPWSINSMGNFNRGLLSIRLPYMYI